MVEPTNVKPRSRRARLSASDSGVRGGTSLRLRQVFWRGAPPTKPQTKRSKVPSSARSARKARAFWTVPRILSRFRTMPGSARSERTLAAP